MAAPLPAPPALSSDLSRDAWLASYADILRGWVAEGRVARVPLSGVSMEPTLAAGVVVVVEGCEPGAIRVGDIVVYEDASGLICHRVLRRRRAPAGRELLTKGDWFRVPPAWVAAASVIGRVVAIETSERHRPLTAPRERFRAHAAMARSWLALLGRALVGAMRRLTFTARPA